MLFSALFELPVSTLQSTHTVGRRAASRKRKRSRPISEDEGHDSAASNIDLDIEHGPGQFSNAPAASQRSKILTPDEIYQYRIAGLSLEQDLPGHNFPHSSGKKPYEKATLDPVTNDFTRDAAKLDGEPQTQENVTLRHQHLAVITAILHRCVQNRDFERASRALGMILRDEFAGHAADVRVRGRWGIGAEILLRRAQPQDNDLPFTRHGFDLARRYYERLVVQHPYHKSAKNAYNELDFNLAILGLWIYVSHEEAQTARGQNIMPEDEEDDADFNSGPRKELQEAREIAQRMDSLMVSPLYSQHVEYIRLRAMVALWLADLSREVADLDKVVVNFDESMNMDDTDSVSTSLAEGVSGVDLNIEDPKARDKRSRRNPEAEESELKATELFALLRTKENASESHNNL